MALTVLRMWEARVTGHCMVELLYAQRPDPARPGPFEVRHSWSDIKELGVKNFSQSRETLRSILAKYPGSHLAYLVERVHESLNFSELRQNDCRLQLMGNCYRCLEWLITLREGGDTILPFKVLTYRRETGREGDDFEERHY
jgi:hypothetical protein